MTDKPTHEDEDAQKAQAAQEAADAQHQADIQQTVVAVKENLTAIAVGVALVIALAVGITFYVTSQRKANARVVADFNEAMTPETLQALVENHPKHSITPAARIRLAAMQYRNRDFSAAKASYDAFLSAHPDHPLAPNARIGQYAAMEALGELEGALAGYRSFPKDHYLAPNAQMGMARCLEQLQRFEEAKAAYQALADGNPETDWAEHAKLNIRLVERQLSAMDAES